MNTALILHGGNTAIVSMPLAIALVPVPGNTQTTVRDAGSFAQVGPLNPWYRYITSSELSLHFQW